MLILARRQVMASRYRHFGLFTIVALTSSLTAQSWLPNACAQTPAAESGQVVKVPVSQLEQIQQELEYLRARDAQRQAWEESVTPRWPIQARPVSTGTISMDNAAGLGGPSQAPCDECIGIDNGCCCGNCLCTEEAPCIDCPRVSTLNPYFNVRLFGAVKLDMIFSNPRPQAPGVPFYLVPGSPSGLSQNTLDIHARQTSIGAMLAGPMVGDFQTGGTVRGVFFDNNVLNDAYGFLPQQAFGELKNDDWRFSAGLQGDVFAPGGPTTLPFSNLGASGNVGNSWRGSLQLARYINLASDSQVTLAGALSEPITTFVSPDFNLDEDNGWPNVEGRMAWGLGDLEPIGLLTQRPFEIGLSGVIGQLRRTSPPPGPQTRTVSDVWGVATDFRLNLAGFYGFAGEVYSGQGLGTYNGAILQTLDVGTSRAIPSSGGWIEGFVYLTPCLHSHTGYGIDDPQNNDVTGVPFSLAGRTFNSTAYSNLLWDVNQAFRVGFEFAYRKTEYKDPTNLPNDGASFHTQFQWAF
jgi:hypothetical protein